jgi:hypothetical protein
LRRAKKKISFTVPEEGHEKTIYLLFQLIIGQIPPTVSTNHLGVFWISLQNKEGGRLSG